MISQLRQPLRSPAKKQPLYLLVLVITALLVGSANQGYSAEEFSPGFMRNELQRMESDPDNVVTVSVNAPKEYVYNFLLRRLDEYTEDASGVTFDHANSNQPGTLSVGSERITTMKDGATLVQRFLMLESPNGYAYFTDMEKSTLSVPLKYSMARYRLSEAGAGQTNLRVAVVYQPSSRLTAFFVRRAFNSALRRDFARAAEIISEDYLKTINR